MEKASRCPSGESRGYWYGPGFANSGLDEKYGAQIYRILHGA
jgi:hypothetical protein